MTKFLFKRSIFISVTILLVASCHYTNQKTRTAKEILGNPDFPAICYGGFRNINRADAPSVEQIKEDVAIMHAAGFRVLRTYHARLHNHTPNLLQAIREMKEANPAFEMYVMIGAWIQCANAWSDEPNHTIEDTVNNQAEIDSAIAMAEKYPDIVKVIAVGNESMVHWASGYFVEPAVVLKWVDHLQRLKRKGELPLDLWITSSDNFASWGGGENYYKTEDLEKLIRKVDYVSLHTYPFHDTHYNPEFWYVPKTEESLDKEAQINRAMKRALNHSRHQYNSVKTYIENLELDKPIHIGETGWATISTDLYGWKGTKAADEFKQHLYFQQMQNWSDSIGISCFFFEAFDEPWKDQGNSNGSENHFGLFTAEGEAKYTMWPMVDAHVFEKLKRGESPVIKTFGGNKHSLDSVTLQPPLQREASRNTIKNVSKNRNPGEPVTTNKLILLTDEGRLNESDYTYPSAKIKLNSWEGTCSISLNAQNIIEINTGSGSWWGCALELAAEGKGENMQEFDNGFIHFDLRGNTQATVQIGFQSGVFALGNQVNAHEVFAPDSNRSIHNEWESIRLPINTIANGANLQDVTSLLYVLGSANTDGNEIQLRNIYWSKQ